jgi:hypothetical protein
MIDANCCASKVLFSMDRLLSLVQRKVSDAEARTKINVMNNTHAVMEEIASDAANGWSCSRITCPSSVRGAECEQYLEAIKNDLCKMGLCASVEYYDNGGYIPSYMNEEFMAPYHYVKVSGLERLRE